MIKIAVGNDHHGLHVVRHILAHNSFAGVEVQWIIMGCDSSVACDYPRYAHQVAGCVSSGQADLGILVCGTGVGMAMAANRFTGIYAAVAWNPIIARRSREEDGCNVLVLPADYVDKNTVDDIVAQWLAASFLKGKYQRRIELIDQPMPRSARD